MERWIRAWLLSWLLMLPIVVLAAPAIRRLTNMLTRDESSRNQALDSFANLRNRPNRN
jgi:hypothetical protein